MAEAPASGLRKTPSIILAVPASQIGERGCRSPLDLPAAVIHRPIVLAVPASQIGKTRIPKPPRPSGRGNIPTSCLWYISRADLRNAPHDNSREGSRGDPCEETARRKVSAARTSPLRSMPPGRSASADNRPKINFFIIYRFASSVLTCKYTGLLRTVQEIRRKYFGERKKGHSPRPGNIRPANRPPTGRPDFRPRFPVSCPVPRFRP